MKIVVAMSGGVDSSVAAALLKKEGHSVTGITMNLISRSDLKGKACFAGDKSRDYDDIGEIVARLGIEHHFIDCGDEFYSTIIDYFREEYTQGRTPNPCVFCNRYIKFGYFIDAVEKMGIEFDGIATGHYARVEFDSVKERYILRKALYQEKDQSYFLSMLSQTQLAKVHFPLGEYRKEDVRSIAHELGFEVHDKDESQDFYSGDYTELFDDAEIPGDIVLRDGSVIGRHRGIRRYTIGQRRGLGIGWSEPLYVIEIDAENQRVVVGTERELYRKSFWVKDCNWISISDAGKDFECVVKTRHMHRGVHCRVFPRSENRLMVECREPERAVTPGQFAVFYEDDRVLGAGVISLSE